ncbi:MAG: hypothetical protein WCQ32_00625 [bacterium]
MLYEFYGEECPHCQRMLKLTAKLMEEFPQVHIERKEIWHNKENMELIKKCDVDDACGGIPFYYNDQNPSVWLCGEVTYAELKKWAGV